jgi:hypothetical protein
VGDHETYCVELRTDSTVAASCGVEFGETQTCNPSWYESTVIRGTVALPEGRIAMQQSGEANPSGTLEAA